MRRWANIVSICILLRIAVETRMLQSLPLSLCCMKYMSNMKCTFINSSLNCSTYPENIYHLKASIISPPLHEVVNITFDNITGRCVYPDAVVTLHPLRFLNSSHVVCTDRRATMAALYKILSGLGDELTSEEKELKELLRRELLSSSPLKRSPILYLDLEWKSGWASIFGHTSTRART